MSYLSYIPKYSQKKNYSDILQMGLKVPGLREEEVASKADTGFVIQVHIPLVAACGRTLWAFLD